MPTTLVGLLIFVAFLTPGLLHYIQRRALAPQRSLSPLVETATLTSISLVTNAVSLSAFGIIRLVVPSHTPDVGALLRQGDQYLIPRLPYVFGWGIGILACSCALAITAARWRWFRSTAGRLFTPVIVDSSAWYQVFEEHADDDSDLSIYVGCDLKDGSYLAGTLAWYSTDTEETGDRDLVLGPPLLRRDSDEEEELKDFGRVIISAREVQTMYVTWLPAEQRSTPDDAPRRAESPAIPEAR